MIYIYGELILSGYGLGILSVRRWFAVLGSPLIVIQRLILGKFDLDRSWSIPYCELVIIVKADFVKLLILSKFSAR